MLAVPYWEIPAIPIAGPIKIQPFGVMVAIGVLLAAAYSRKKAEAMGVDEDTHRSYIGWLLVSGFIGAHVFDTLFYEPHRLVEDPLVILKVWQGISSYGGILGAVFGFVYFTWSRRVSPLAYADIAGWGLLPGWIFGRLGCALVHDHPGGLSDFFLAINFPSDASIVRQLGLQPGPRHDLGFYEFLYLILAFGGLLLLTRKKRPVGFVIAYVALAYAPVRFFLEFLRLQVTDPRYLGLTFAQYVSIGMFVLGTVLMVRAYRTRDLERRVMPEGTGADERPAQQRGPSRNAPGKRGGSRKRKKR